MDGRAVAASAALATAAVVGAAFCYHTVAVAKRDREEERKGRIKAEQRLRDLKNAEVASTGYHMRVIGTHRSAFSTRWGTPRQPGLCPHTSARIELHPDVPADALDGLEAFSHAWVVWGFHMNTNAATPAGGAPPAAATQQPGVGGAPTLFAGLHPRIRAPALGGRKVGVFGCRSPHRPNAVGLSLVRVVRVLAPRGKHQLRAVEVAGADLLDGTPVFDIKPFHPVCDTPAAAAGAAPRLSLSPAGAGADPEPAGTDWQAAVRAALEAGRGLVVAWGSQGQVLAGPTDGPADGWAWCPGEGGAAGASSDAALRRACAGVVTARARAPLWVWKAVGVRVSVSIDASALRDLAALVDGAAARAEAVVSAAEAAGAAAGRDGRGARKRARREGKRAAALPCAWEVVRHAAEVLSLDVRGVRQARYSAEAVKTFDLDLHGVRLVWEVEAADGVARTAGAEGPTVVRVTAAGPSGVYGDDTE